MLRALESYSSKCKIANREHHQDWRLRGGTGALIAKQAKNCGIGDMIYLCDTFTGVVKAGPNDSAYKGGEHKDTTRQVVDKLIFSQMKLDNVKILEGIFPDQTGNKIGDLRLDSVI